MEATIELLKSLQDQDVAIVFIDGCSMDVKIIETMHLDEGDDFAADVLKVNCSNPEHNHFVPGTAINIRVEDIESINKL